MAEQATKGKKSLCYTRKLGEVSVALLLYFLLYFLLLDCIIQSWNLSLFAGPHIKVHCICFSLLIILKLSQLCFQGKKKENEKFHVQ